MSILNELEKSINSDIPAYIEFLYRYDPKKQQVFVFYEGDEDASFYQQFIRKTIGNGTELEEIVAGCRNNVIKLHDEFNWESYSKRQIVFFIDRDPSHWLGDDRSYDDNVFITDGYSVENYMVNKDSFVDWLTRCMGFARAAKSEIDKIKDEFLNAIQCFRALMMPIMAKAVVAKRHDGTICLSTYKPINDIHFEIKANHINVLLSSNSTIDTKWRLNSNDTSEINHQEVAFQNDIGNYWVRGKWDLLFMATLGDFMRQHAIIFAPSLQKEKLNPTCGVPLTQCVTVLAPYWKSPTPKRLECFLNQTVALYCKSAA